MVCKWADRAARLIKRKVKSQGAAYIAHDECNMLLYKLRCGGRRGEYKAVRNALRNYRKRLTETWNFPVCK